VSLGGRDERGARRKRSALTGGEIAERRVDDAGKGGWLASQLRCI